MSHGNHAALRMAFAEAIEEITGHAAQTISDDDDITDDLGVDSMAAAGLLVAFEDRFGARLPDGFEGSLVGTRRVGDLVERLAALYGISVTARASEPTHSPPQKWWAIDR